MTTRQSHKSTDELQRGLGADAPFRVRTDAHGPFGVMQLAAELAERLRPGAGTRPGRPTDPEWEIRRLVAFRRETWNALAELAERSSTPHRRVSPAQIAAVLVEEGVKRMKTG